MNYSPEICSAAQQIIDDRRTAAAAELAVRRRKVTAEAPEIEEIERQAASAAAKLSGLIVSKSRDFSESFERIKKNNLEAQDYIRRILVSHGFPADCLMIKYTCPDCSDTGFVPDGTRCHCFTELAGRLSAEELNKSANMPDCDFAHFSLSYYPREMSADGIVPYDKMSEVLSFCRDYAASFRPGSESLLMIGRTGIGKTHLSLSIAREVMTRGYTCVYGSAMNFLTDMENEQFGRAPADRSTMAALTAADLLVLDDLGAENRTAFYESYLYNIINSRINLGRPSVISTNLDRRELLSRYNERILSRIFGVYTVLPFYGKDIRQLKRIGSL